MGSEGVVEATVVRATQPDGAGRGGFGIAVQQNPDTGEGGQLRLTASLVEQNHVAGVLVLGAEATIAATTVRATKPVRGDASFGDGILVLDDLRGSSAVVIATESTDNARAGVIYVGSAGELSGVRSSGNRFGLVLQPGASGAKPVLGEGNVFEGNTEQDKVEGGDLAVPDALPLLP